MDEKRWAIFYSDTRRTRLLSFFLLLPIIVCHLGLGGVHSAKNFFRMQSTLSIRTVTAKRHVAKLENVSSFKVTPSNRSSSWNCYGQLVSFSCWVLLLLYQLHVLYVVILEKLYYLGYISREDVNLGPAYKWQKERHKRGCTLLITVYYILHSFLDFVSLAWQFCIQNARAGKIDNCP